ncbi:MAG: bifunctional diaminohydroxyphosphoribosylaminopyrimidine deaminase/5-amino-6-(5-phosphoribosylamino)uracil reductase RibD [Candidatus Aphodousia sp.]|nr:bifunctional diaminohydroxyphosphoribosylaminopyrimidine deaminase/5-amino-6-(5-phosphoribosylamino)uracil reductase RibD [Sutterella sp.]MDY2900221.1 bifunctional diaminohydroxyphosphoribosylaminopyrimidine deaminase/5-amino-6-(5-phosphoribosylamino)uracil reductase RibD [Candidatus Aphodousia sp.]
MNDDIKYMRRALELARLARPISPPNPSVGCVIVRNGNVLGEGFTQQTGGDHAEIQAIKDALAKGHKLDGATVYVTLEPCSHFGRTPPCADRLIREGVSRVVVACEDPNPKVSGRGISILRNAKIEVVTGVCEKEAREVNIGFMTRMIHKRPWVRLKVAMSLDGFTALPSGQSQWITSKAAREDGVRWRSVAGAVVTGLGTVTIDNPQMTARVDGKLCLRQPLRVVLDSQLRVDPESKIFDLPGALVIAARGDRDNVKALRDRGVEVLMVPGAAGHVDLRAVLKELTRREVNEVHVEAGSVLSGAFLEEDLVDEIICYIAPKVLGLGRPAFAMPALKNLNDAARWQMIEQKTIGDDVRLILRKRN